MLRDEKKLRGPKQMKGVDGIYSSTRTSCHSRCRDTLAAERWNGSPHSLGKKLHRTGNQGTRSVDVGCPHDPLHDRDGCLAHSANSIVGRLLSLAISSIMGVRVLFFGHQLLDRWIRGHCSPESVANLGTNGERYGRPDVWYIGERPVCHRDPAGRGWGPSSRGEPELDLFRLSFCA